MASVTETFSSNRLGNLYLWKPKNKYYRLRRLPIKRDHKEERELYLVNINDISDIVTEIIPEEWEEIGNHHDPRQSQDR